MLTILELYICTIVFSYCGWLFGFFKFGCLRELNIRLLARRSQTCCAAHEAVSNVSFDCNNKILEVLW